MISKYNIASGEDLGGVEVEKECDQNVFHTKYFKN